MRELELVRRFVEERHSDAAAVLLAGSRSRGEGRGNSDYDVVLLFAEVPAAWRAMEGFEGAALECFAHDLGTLRYFLDEVERPSGKPVLARMIVEGLAVVGEAAMLLAEARAMAARMLAAGPPAWSNETVAARRYAISEMAESLRGGRAGDRLAVGSALYGALGEFATGVAGRWGGAGKGLATALRETDARLAEEMDAAFEALFAGEDDAAVQGVVDRLLGVAGGRLRVGFSQKAPGTWRR